MPINFKTYSITQFFNELDLLELRLETLDPVVDYFVISESTKTHSGLDKLLYYNENKDRYKKFHHKIIHQIIDYVPSYEEILDTQNDEFANESNKMIAKRIIDADWFDKSVRSYIRDTYEKEALVFPLLDKCDKADLILFSDLDEIAKPERVIYLKNVLYKIDEVYNFEHEMFYYYLNLQKTNEKWFGTLACSFDKLIKEDSSLCKFRTKKGDYKIFNAGWHFTYQGGVDKVKQKVNSWGEQSLNTLHIQENIENNIENCIKYKRDLFFRPAEWKIRNIEDGTFPKYIVENQDKFRHMLYRQEEHVD